MDTNTNPGLFLPGTAPVDDEAYLTAALKVEKDRHDYLERQLHAAEKKTEESDEAAAEKIFE